MCSRGSSLVDYCIVNIELLSDFSSFYVHDPNMLSDLCLSEFAFSSSFVLLDENMYSENDGAHFHYYKFGILIPRKSISPLYPLASLKRKFPH